MKKNKSRGGRPRKLQLAWPAADKPLSAYTDAEMNAVLLHPMCTGVGNHPKTVSDADYIASCCDICRQFGPSEFASGLLQLLQGTDDLPWALPPDGPKPAVPEPVQPRTDSGKQLNLPLPRAKVPTNESVKGGWDAGLVIGMAVNPVYAGLGPFPPIISSEQWVAAFSAMLRKDGTIKMMVDFLYVLRSTFGAYGVTPGCLAGWQEHDGD